MDFKTAFGCKKLKTNPECLTSFCFPRNIAADVVKNVLRKHATVTFSLFFSRKKIQEWIVLVSTCKYKVLESYGVSK